MALLTTWRERDSLYLQKSHSSPFQRMQHCVSKTTASYVSLQSFTFLLLLALANTSMSMVSSTEGHIRHPEKCERSTFRPASGHVVTKQIEQKECYLNSPKNEALTLTPLTEGSV